MMDNFITGVKSNVTTNQFTIHANAMSINIKFGNLVTGYMFKSAFYQVFPDLFLVLVYALA